MWEDGELSWLLAAASFDNEEQELGKTLENEGVYMGKKLTTNTAVPGRLCRDKSYAEFYKEVLEADEIIVNTGEIINKKIFIQPIGLLTQIYCSRLAYFY